jgi:transposase InsO family protein
MSRKGNCWDNAPMESFFGTLKTEISTMGFIEPAAKPGFYLRICRSFFTIGVGFRRKLGFLSPVSLKTRFSA